MKLLFPIFASLMLQYQVNTEYFGLGRCVMGFGRCKDHCAMDEKEVDKCKKKKCCIGPKVVRLIKSYIQNEMLHTLEEDSQELLKITKNFSVVMQTKNHTLSLLPKFRSVNPFANINTIVIPNATTVNSATTNPMMAGKIIHTATSTKSDTKKRRDSATDSPPPAPPP
ncbi:Beta-defensin-like protein, partial [Eschrichtius robustus]|uniref:beta-defensin 129 n=1 Tax=Eschrichtius robustus TaxID=9764 RepID=UPI000C410817|nr:Beta-defensin-like protein [Eschrichtius robustus]